MAIGNLTDLHAFATVARLRSFRRAAVELGVSPSALSHTLRSLEDKLGLRLLNRTTRSVAPTAAGEMLLGRLSPALLDIQSALDEVNAFRDSPLGTLRINASRPAAELVLAPLVTAFLQRHPGMEVELVTDDRLVDIVAEGFDAGVRFGERLQQDMVAIPLGPSQRFVVVASPSYLARHGTPESPRELDQHRCIRLRFPSGSIYHWEFSRAEESLEIEVNGPLTVGEMSLQVSAAEAGLGLAYVYHQYAAPGLTAGRLVTVLDDWRPEIPGFFLYYPSRRLMPAGLRAFVELLKEQREQFIPQP
ncbi:LysR family transcriptional regulator [Chitinimonas lacunae]|uniref:LysR family transcriptional regulator n=1 Tax=Chitinimonas lacunae TaxID=1963018 RepID=A0ABV8MMP8_9NEIS